MRAVTDPGVVTTRQTITPAGVQAVFQGRVHGLAFGASGDQLWVLNAGHVYRFDWKNNRVLAHLQTGGSAGLQGIRFDAETGHAYIAGALKGKVHLWAAGENGLEVIAGDLGSHIAGAIALAEKGIAVVPLIYDNRAAVIDLARRRVTASVPTGIAPFGVTVNAAGTVAYVSNWGGRLPKPGDLTARTGLLPTADQVVVDQRGIAATGTVTRIDLAAARATHTIPVELHTGMCIHTDG